MIDAIAAAGIQGSRIAPSFMTRPSRSSLTRLSGGAFGPATVIEHGTAPSVFVIYDETGAPAPLGPNPRLASTTGLDESLPSQTLYDRIGSTIKQIQLTEHDAHVDGQYSIGYGLLV